MARDLGAQVVIAVDLGELLPQTFPTNLFGVAKRSTEIQFLWQSYFCTSDADVRIQPKMCEVGTFNDKCKMQLYEAGRAAAYEALPQIRAALAKAINALGQFCASRATFLCALCVFAFSCMQFVILSPCHPVIHAACQQVCWITAVAVR